MEFSPDNNARSNSGTNHRPWQSHRANLTASTGSSTNAITAGAPSHSHSSSSPYREQKQKQQQQQQRYREPYELLDDVPPAILSTHNDHSLDRRDAFELLDDVSPASPTRGRNVELFPDGLLPEDEQDKGGEVHAPSPRGGRSRYPVDELYPTDNVEDYYGDNDHRYEEEEDGYHSRNRHSNNYYEEDDILITTQGEEEDSKYYDDYSNYNNDSRDGYSIPHHSHHPHHTQSQQQLQHQYHSQRYPMDDNDDNDYYPSSSYAPQYQQHQHQHQHQQQQQSPPTPSPSRYPIDDDPIIDDAEEETVYSKQSSYGEQQSYPTATSGPRIGWAQPPISGPRVGWHDDRHRDNNSNSNSNNDMIGIVESRSDSEISEYRPMHTSGTSSGNYGYDNDGYSNGDGNAHNHRHHNARQDDDEYDDDYVGDVYGEEDDCRPRPHHDGGRSRYAHDNDNRGDEEEDEDEDAKSQNSFDRLYEDEEDEQEEGMTHLDNTSPRSNDKFEESGGVTPVISGRNDDPYDRNSPMEGMNIHENMNTSNTKINGNTSTPSPAYNATPSSYNAAISTNTTPSSYNPTPTDDKWKQWEDMNHPIDVVAKTPQRSNITRYLHQYNEKQQQEQQREDIFRIGDGKNGHEHIGDYTGSSSVISQDSSSSSSPKKSMKNRRNRRHPNQTMSYSSSEGEDSAIRHLANFQGGGDTPGSDKLHATTTTNMQVEPRSTAQIAKSKKKSSKLEPTDVEPREPEGMAYGAATPLHRNGACAGFGREPQLFPDIPWDTDGTGNNNTRQQPHYVEPEYESQQHSTADPPSPSSNNWAEESYVSNNVQESDHHMRSPSSHYEEISERSPRRADPNGEHYFAHEGGDVAFNDVYHEDEYETGQTTPRNDGDFNFQTNVSIDSAASSGDTPRQGRKGNTDIASRSPHGHAQQYSSRATKKSPRRNHRDRSHNHYEEPSVDSPADEESSEDSAGNDDSIHLESNIESMADDISFISEDSALRRLGQRAPKKTQRLHPYAIKRKDSIEDDMRIDYDEGDKEKKLHPYDGIKRQDSMENDMMNIDFGEEMPHQKEFVDDFLFGKKSGAAGTNSYKGSVTGGAEEFYGKITSDSVISPPDLKRKTFNFNDDADMYHYDDAHKVSDNEEDSMLSSRLSSEDESEASDDPGTFPSKAIFRMNLGLEKGDKYESEELVEKACDFLSRGRNEDALKTLSVALRRAQNDTNHAKQMLDDHYVQKDRDFDNSKRGKQRPNLEEEEFEDQLKDNVNQAASEMADIINNIGVVHEMDFNFKAALTSFQEALDVYRNICHRYENSGDPGVDQTVNNIMQMGIALRSQTKRHDLHSEADEIAAAILSTRNSSACVQMRMERLNILMCVLDVEIESLGKNHPAVGYTLMKKGRLHLEMMHIDMAIKDIREAIAIFEKGLGPIHPDVGLALKSLADIFNYGTIGDRRVDRNTALALYEKALVPFRECFGKVHSDLGLTHNSIGIIHCINNDVKLAMESFYSALSGYGVRARGDEASKGQTRPDVFFVWINVGDLHMDNNEWQLALRSYQKAHSAFKCLDDDEKLFLQKIGPKMLMRPALTLTKNKSFDNNDTLLASVLQNIGKAQSMLHQYGKAIETLEEALRIHQVIEMRGKGLGSSSSRDVARILENLGEVQVVCGNLTSAKSHYVKSLNILRSTENVYDSGVEVALVLGAIGRVHLKKGEYSEAKVILKECLRSLEKIGTCCIVIIGCYHSNLPPNIC